MVAKKKAAVIAALCMLLLLIVSRPPHQQFSHRSCDCYRECYPRCKRTFPILCKVECGGSCDDTGDRVRACLEACAMDSMCGLPVAPSASITACSRVCNKFWGGGGPDKKLTLKGEGPVGHGII